MPYLCHALCSFERVHPAVADVHYLRTWEENERLRSARMEVERVLHIACQLNTKTANSTRRMPSVGDQALPALQLPDWDRIASPRANSPASAKLRWMPVSPHSKTDAVTAPASPGSRVVAQVSQLQHQQPTAQAKVGDLGKG